MKILVTGATGLLGSNLAASLADRHCIVGTVHRHQLHLPNVTTLPLDLRDARSVEQGIARERPDVVFHAAGLTDVEQCERDPVLARQLNTDAATVVARGARQAGAKLIHVSTDHLFDGTRAWYAEESEPAPLNVYARTKLEAEHHVQREHPEALLVRTNFFGWGHDDRMSFSDWIVAALRAGRRVQMFHDVFFTPILVNDLIAIALQLVEGGASGILNVAGRERLSKLAFGVEVARTFGLPPELIEPRSVEGFQFQAARPRDMSLDSRNAAERLRRPLPDVREGLERLCALERSGFAASLRVAVKAR